MGKKQHQSDKMYITQKEWSSLFGGKRVAQGTLPKDFRRLPFDCCALTFQPFEHPVCDENGNVFDLVNILPFVQKYGINPVTGQPLETKSLTRLHFHKNADGKYHCPVSFKIFNENTHITAIKSTGNVYASDAVDKFNVKAKYWKDLLTDEPFTRKDMVVIQDPHSLDKFNMQTFHHLKAGLKLNEEAEKAKLQDPSFFIRTTKGEASSVMAELKATEKEWKKPELNLTSSLESSAMSAPSDKKRTAHFSTGEMARSFTSTHLTPRTLNTAATISEDEVKFDSIKDKGYVALHTSLGDLNLELHCDLTPRTCQNFLTHCRNGYYNGTIFHRNMRNFMIQGGDPTGTGRGGASIFDGGKPFKDEFRRELSHNARGLLCMANSGPDTNKSQFYITYRKCPHLDRKHTIFGRVVGQMDTLAKMEKVEVDDKNKPLEPIKIESTTVFKDPIQDYEEAVHDKVVKEEETKKEAEKRKRAAEPPKALREGVGKYLKMPRQESGSDSGLQSTKRKKTGGFGDFSGW